MTLLTIGAFARASRLSPKALRLYDELGLLPPARVDPVTGYRLYERGQLERARLVAWLRRIGMPLARIAEVCALPPGAAAEEIRAYWARVEADTAARRDLAAFLVDHLSRKDSDMPTSTTEPLGIRYAALCDRGLVREANQDTAYAGPRLLAVADGFGPSGARASAAAVDALQQFDAERYGGEGGTVPAGELLNALQDAVADAVTGPDPAGTTLTALLRTGPGAQLALVHIGDTSVRLLRDGELFQITHDHTLVQSMVDEGRLTPEEALTHPRRSLLVRALGAAPEGDDATALDLRPHEARPGDRYLLCSDGLSTVVPENDIRRVLTGTPEPEHAVRALVDLANAAGGPDNISCVVADVVPAHD
ncbi:MerR family transcriptional regulator [Streptomyces sp. NPDC046939]|uniref:MerR family transcriptional regulator n=1 Tax=Streptomyces sp. NPDC046939 TaxID=3155376 RepID=UPI00340B81F3